ncbi:hypothetical protein GPALN_011748 [Globodera pallida]|nr:hypothetical protein GPALN_011748 [Globodera pallida]
MKFCEMGEQLCLPPMLCPPLFVGGDFVDVLSPFRRHKTGCRRQAFGCPGHRRRKGIRKGCWLTHLTNRRRPFASHFGPEGFGPAAHKPCVGLSCPGAIWSYAVCAYFSLPAQLCLGVRRTRRQTQTVQQPISALDNMACVRALPA